MKFNQKRRKGITLNQFEKKIHKNNGGASLLKVFFYLAIAGFLATLLLGKLLEH